MATLVTGGKGFIGSRIIRRLVDAGERVVCLEPKTTPGRLGELASQVTMVEGGVERFEDVLAAVERREITRIAHMVYVTAGGRPEELQRETTIMVGGTANVFEAARRYNIKRVIFPSSIAYHGPQWLHGERPLGEEDPSLAVTPYGVSKRLAEVLASQYNERSGLEIVSVRIPVVYGPGGRLGARGVNIIATEGALERPVTAPQDADERVCIGHVEDVADIIVRLLEAEQVQHRVYHIGGHTVSYQQLADMAREVLPDLQVSFHQVRPIDLPYLIDGSRLAEELGFRHRDPRQAYHQLINLTRREAGLPPV